MKKDQRKGEKFRKKSQGSELIFLTCLCLAIASSVSSKSVTVPLAEDADSIQLVASDDLDSTPSIVALGDAGFTELKRVNPPPPEEAFKKHSGNGVKKIAGSPEKRSGKHQLSRDVIALNGSLSLSVADPTNPTSTSSDFSTSDDRESTDSPISTTDLTSTSEESTKFSNEVWTSSTGHSSTSTAAPETESESASEQTDVSSSTDAELTSTSETEVPTETVATTSEDEETTSTTFTSITSGEPTTSMVTTTLSLPPTKPQPPVATTQPQKVDTPLSTLTLTTTSTTTMLPTSTPDLSTTTTTTTTATSSAPSTTETHPPATTAETETPFASTSTANASTSTVPSTVASTVASTVVSTAKSTSIPTTSLSVTPTAETPSAKTTSPLDSETPAAGGTSPEGSSTNVVNTTVPTKGLPTKEITLLIRIVFKGSWRTVCSELQSIRQSLLNLVNNNVENNEITSKQIVFHETHCSNDSSETTMQENESTPLYLYVVDGNGNLDQTLTKILPSIYETTHVSFPLSIESFELVQLDEAESGSSGSNVTAIIVATCAGLVCLFLLGGLIFVMRKRQGRFNYGERCRPVSLDAYSLDSVSAYSSVRRSKLALRASKRSYGNPTFEDASTIPSHPLNFAGLASFCNDLSGIADEFSGVPQVSSKIDELPAGAELKNRYANVIPLPETRVPLQRLNNDPLTEYVNASYVRGPKNASKYYIASQAPTENTVCDFWRMIWEQQVKVVIMLTDLVENDVEKCVEYIPPLEVSDCHRLYGDYQVTLRKRETKDKYAISSLQLKNLESNTFREVSHFWYLWPTNGVPSDSSALISVLLESRALQRGAASPILVHCSPGTGRTGTLIALDLVMRQYEVTRTIDVPRVVYTIRRDRAGAVQTKEQYTFIYKAINLYASKLAGGAVDSN